MTKDDQIKHLTAALEAIRDDHAPWHGEDAVCMMNNAHDALVELEAALQPSIKVAEPLCLCPLRFGDCEHCSNGRCDSPAI